MTVPAYQWLWSGHDEINHHHRRYTRRSLQRVAERGGMAPGAHHLLQLAAPARGNHAAGARPREHQDDRVPAWICGCPTGTSQPAAASCPMDLEGRRWSSGAGRIPAGLNRLAPCASRPSLRPPRRRWRCLQGAPGRSRRGLRRRCSRSPPPWRRPGPAACRGLRFVDEHVEQRLVDRQATALDDPPADRGERVWPTCSRKAKRRLSRKPLTAPTMKPIAEAARYHTSEALQQQRVDG